MASADTNKKEKLATELVLSGPDWFPLGGQDAPDPLRLVLGQLADLADDEQALVQVVARPATAREQRRLLPAGSGYAPPNRRRVFCACSSSYFLVRDSSDAPSSIRR